jgi:ribosomal protein S18 acetylase RimI-like enzyme
MGVRRATTSDLDRLLELWKSMWAVHADQDPRFEASPAAEPVMRAWFESDLENDRAVILVAESGSRIVGFARAMVMENPPVVPAQTFGYLSDLSVEDDARGEGRGTELVKACHEWFRSMGVPYAEVNVAVRNPQSRAFYEKCGYRAFIDRMRLEL